MDFLHTKTNLDVCIVPCEWSGLSIVDTECGSANHRGRISSNRHAYIQKCIYMDISRKGLPHAACRVVSVLYCTVYVACSVHSCGVLLLAYVGWPLTDRESVVTCKCLTTHDRTIYSSSIPRAATVHVLYSTVYTAYYCISVHCGDCTIHVGPTCVDVLLLASTSAVIAAGRLLEKLKCTSTISNYHSHYSPALVQWYPTCFPFMYPTIGRQWWYPTSRIWEGMCTRTHGTMPSKKGDFENFGGIALLCTSCPVCKITNLLSVLPTMSPVLWTSQINPSTP